MTAEDIDFQLRLGEMAKIMYLPHNFYMYRLHDASITHTQGNIKRIFFENTARSFLSQRRESGQDDLQRGIPPDPPGEILDIPEAAGKQIQGILIGAAWNAHCAGNRWKAIVFGYRALKYNPRDVRMWRSFLALVVKPIKKGLGKLKRI